MKKLLLLATGAVLVLIALKEFSDGTSMLVWGGFAVVAFLCLFLASLKTDKKKNELTQKELYKEAGVDLKQE